MLKVVLGVVAAAVLGQALPAPQVFPGYSLQSALYPISEADTPRLLRYTSAVQDTREVQVAKEEFMVEFSRALTGLLVELAPQQVKPQYLEDTPEVEKAKEEFLVVFNKALNGLIDTAYLEDTQEVKAAKEEFFKTFDAAMNGLITTVENFYIEDTAEVKAAKVDFNKAFEDAKNGIVGAQYIDYTPEVKAAREEFFKAFEFALSGMLYKLAPKPVENFYIPDTVEVAAAKAEFAKIYSAALNGDLSSAIAVVALEEAIINNKGDVEKATQEFISTTKQIQDAISNDEGLIDQLENEIDDEKQDEVSDASSEEESLDEEVQEEEEDEAEEEKVVDEDYADESITELLSGVSGVDSGLELNTATDNNYEADDEFNVYDSVA